MTSIVVGEDYDEFETLVAESLSPAEEDLSELNDAVLEHMQSQDIDRFKVEQVNISCQYAFYFVILKLRITAILMTLPLTIKLPLSTCPTYTYTRDHREKKLQVKGCVTLKIFSSHSTIICTRLQSC